MRVCICIRHVVHARWPHGACMPILARPLPSLWGKKTQAPSARLSESSPRWDDVRVERPLVSFLCFFTLARRRPSGMKFRRPHFGVGDKAKAHSLTGPTNLVSIVGHVPAPAEAPALPVQPTPSLTELDGQVDAMLAEMRFSSAVPINAWIRRADTLKRQADQHHIAGDLARQYVWYVPVLWLTILVSQPAQCRYQQDSPSGS